MRKYLWGVITGLLCLLTSCEGNVEDMIPAQSRLVFSIDLDRMGDKSGMDNDKLETEIAQFTNRPSGGGLRQLMQHPLILSALWEDKAYGFTTEDYIGIAANVRSSSTLEDFMKAMYTQHQASALEERGGYNWTVYKNNWIIGFDSKRFLMMGPVPQGAQPMLRQNMLALFKQSKDDSFSASPAFDKLDSEKGDIRVYAPLSNLPDLMGTQFALNVPEDADKEDIDVYLTLDFEKGKIHIDGESSSENKDLASQMKTSAHSLPTVKGVFLNQAPANFLVWGSMGLNGDNTLKQLKQNKTISDFLLAMNAGVDADMIMKSTKGDASFSVPYLKDNGDMAFCFHAQLANTSFLNDVDYWKQSVAKLGKGSRMTDAGKNCYNLRMPDFNGQFGVKPGNVFYATNDLSSLTLPTGTSPLLAPYANQVKGAVSFTLINVAGARRIKALADAIGLVGRYVPQIQQLVSHTKMVVMKATSGNSGTIDFISADPQLNYIQTLMK